MTFQRPIVAAAVQCSPVLFSRAQTTEKVCALIEEAAGKGAELIVFPETFIPYYPYFSFITPPYQMGAEHLRLYEESVAVPSDTTLELGAAARRAGAVVAIGINERDHGTLYNTQLIFDADGILVQSRRKITPTYHERMVWGQGDGSGLVAVNTKIGRIGALACWEHYNPLARYAMMADHEQIHVAMFPGSMVGPVFRDQIEVTIRHHALESGCFVVNSTGFLHPEQVATLCGGAPHEKALQGGCFTAIVSPEGKLLGEPITSGEGMVIAELDPALVLKRKRMMDSVGHYSRPELLSLHIDRRVHTQAHAQSAHPLHPSIPSSLHPPTLGEPRETHPSPAQPVAVAPSATTQPPHLSPVSPRALG